LHYYKPPIKTANSVPKSRELNGLYPNASLYVTHIAITSENYDSRALRQAQKMNKPVLLAAVVATIFGLCVPKVSAQESLTPQLLLLGRAEAGSSLKVSGAKLEAGCALALHLTGTYELFSSREADSVAKILVQSSGGKDTLTNISARRIAQAVSARGILFVRLDRLENIIRAEVRIASDSTYSTISTGRGFALIRYRSEKMNDVVSDPAILSAIQRALCVALGDSSLYAGCEGAYRVQPAPTVVPGGMVFYNTSAAQPWIVFDKRTVAAFDAVVNVFDTLKNSAHVVCLDVDSRDSIYALFKLYVPENDAAPSFAELDALHRLEIEYYITGTCTKTDTGADITLSLARINKGGTYTVVRSVQSVLTDDNIVQFRAVVRGLAGRLVHEHFGAKSR
jgi:hypothetical protein